ncbi:UNVERIFIED_ORG: putative ABC transport system permease protein [Microbispora rosea subsp. rosea]
MSAVWRAARAAVRRRRIQTIVIALVVLSSTTTILLALALLASASAPFERADARQHGAHAVAIFDTAKATHAQLAQTARRPGVQAAAGPFDQAVIDIPEDWLWRPPGPLTVVGRADPAGPVDRLDLLTGRWADKPGEIVVNWPIDGTPGADLLGSKLHATGIPALTVVGFAVSMSRSADAWVSPEQMSALRPASAQMLYRFTASSTDRQLHTALATVTAQLPPGALTTLQSYLSLKRAFSAKADAYLPFMTVFGVIGLVVSVLIVANVVSGAVVSGYRHIGVLKALGFTPHQVVAVYLTMVCVPAVAGAVLGVLLGALLSEPILRVAFASAETGTASIGLNPWLPGACLLGMPVLVALTALIPALRVHRLSAARAISAGSAPQTGRGLRVQHMLGGTRLPRAISLGLGQPFARPARTVLTLMAIVCGVTTVTLTTGLTITMDAYWKAGRTEGAAQIDVQTGTAASDRPVPHLSDSQIETLLKSLPGADRVTARALLQVRIEGFTQLRFVNFYRGDTSAFAAQIVKGRWAGGPGEVTAGPAFLSQHGLTIGDQITLHAGGKQGRVSIVGELMDGNPRALYSHWETLARLAPGTKAVDYTVQLTPGADPQAFIRTVKAADPGLYPAPGNSGSFATTAVVGFSSLFTALLTIVAALGVFNTVLLATRERRRDLGTLKSIGMTPRQVVTMTVSSVASLGVVGGLLGIPAGIVAHRLLVDNAVVVTFPESMKDVWHMPQLAALALAGVAIAVLGALVPARSAARMTAAKVLRSE